MKALFRSKTDAARIAVCVIACAYLIYSIYLDIIFLSVANVHENTVRFIATAAGITILKSTAAVLLLSLCFAKIRNGRIYFRKFVFILIPVLMLPAMIYSYIFVQNNALLGHFVSGDESSMLFQAELFEAGKLYNENIPVSVAGHFKRHHVVMTEHLEFSKYPPGFPLLLAAFKKAGSENLANIAVTVLCFLLIYLIIYMISGYQITAVLASLLFIFATTVIFHAASYFSHPMTMLFLLFTVFFFLLAEKSGKSYFYILAGIAQGLNFIVRPFDAALIILAFILYFLPEIKKEWKVILRKTLLALAGIIPFLVVFLIYQKIYTGSFFKSPYSLYLFSTNLATGQNLGEVTVGLSHYIFKGLGGFSWLWLKAQAHWSNQYLLWIALLLPVIRFKTLKKAERLIIALPLAYLFGYALHNAAGGDSFGGRYYYPVLWCWFYGAAEVFRFITERYYRYLHFTLYFLFLGLIALYFHKDFQDKTVGIYGGVFKRFSIYSYTEDAVPAGEKAIVLIKRPFAMDPAFFTRHRFDYSDRLIYGRYYNESQLFEKMKKYFPDRSLYIFDYNKENDTVLFERISERDDEKRQNTDSR